jgi:hypothetical protein
MQTRSDAQLPFRAADLRPRWALAGSRSYYWCALSPDEALVAFAVHPLRYDDVGNAGPDHNLLPTGAPRRVAHADIWVAPLADNSADGAAARAAEMTGAAGADTGSGGAAC